MNNKQLGTAFERELVEELRRKGFWVHFISPNSAGAQPFDVIAVKDGRAIAGDCKTSVRRTFSIDRLEDNQVLAFQRWLDCGNDSPLIFIKYRDKIKVVSYLDLCMRGGKVDLDEI